MTKRFHSQFCQADLGIRYPVCNVQPGATVGGRVAIYEDEGRLVASTFRMGLPEGSELQESLTKRPPEDVRQLMRRIEEYKRIENDRLQSKGKALIKSFSTRHFFAETPKRFKDARTESTNGGGERGIQGADAQDCRPD